MAFRWRANVGLTLKARLEALLFFQGIRTSTAKIPYICVIFRGGGCPDPLSPSDSAHDDKGVQTCLRLCCSHTTKSAFLERRGPLWSVCCHSIGIFQPESEMCFIENRTSEG